MAHAHPSHPSPDDRREDRLFRLLRAIDTDPDLSQRGLARVCGVSLGAANALLNRLIAEGLVEVATPDSPGARFRLAYGLSQAGRAQMAARAGGYLARRRNEHEALGEEIAALKALTEPQAPD